MLIELAESSVDRQVLGAAASQMRFSDHAGRRVRKKQLFTIGSVATCSPCAIAGLLELLRQKGHPQIDARLRAGVVAGVVLIDVVR